MEKPEVLSQETVYQSKFFKVYKVKLRKKGHELEKDIIERRAFVLILPITEEGDIYMVKQYRDALGKVSLEVVAGAMDDNENPLDAAKRELKEETGLSAENWKQITTFHVSANMKGVAHVFLASNLTTGEATPDEDEELEVVKISLSEAIEKVASGEIDVASNVASILLVKMLKEQNKLY